MKILKQIDTNEETTFLHNEEGNCLMCPFQDSGSVIKVTVPDRPQLVGGAEAQPVQVVDKRHLPCGSWCALLDINPKLGVVPGPDDLETQEIENQRTVHQKCAPGSLPFTVAYE